MNNKQILEEWKSKISKFEKLKIHEAKALYKEMENEKDLDVKQEKLTKLIEGTLYVIANYISNDDIYFLNSSSFDMNDIISAFNETWIETILDGRLSEMEHFSFTFNHFFYSKATDKLLTNKYRIHNNLGINILEFYDIIMDYISFKQSNYNFNIKDFTNYIKTSDCLSEKSLESINISELYTLLDSIYESLIQSSDNITISRSKLEKMVYLIINNGLEVSRPDINLAYCDDFALATDEEIFFNGLKELVFTNNLINSKSQEILRRRYGMDPYSKPETYRQIANEMDISHRWAEVVENTSLKKIRNSAKVMKYLKK